MTITGTFRKSLVEKYHSWFVEVAFWNFHSHRDPCKRKFQSFFLLTSKFEISKCPRVIFVRTALRAEKVLLPAKYSKMFWGLSDFFDFRQHCISKTTGRRGTYPPYLQTNFFVCFSKFLFYLFIYLQFFFFSFSLTWDHMGEKISNDISSESTHQIHSQKILNTPGEDLYQSYSKNCGIWHFGFLPWNVQLKVCTLIQKRAYLNA